MHTIAISLGDINGVGLEIALKSHSQISQICKPLYLINRDLLRQGAEILGYEIPNDFEIFSCGENFEIKPGQNCKFSGEFSYLSFLSGIQICQNLQAKALVTLPVNKLSWKLAGVNYAGHTEMMRDYFSKNAIMMLGCQELFVGLFTDHIALKEVSKMIKFDALCKFMFDFYKTTKFDKIAILGFNPHASDGGVIGGEEEIEITKAIEFVNLSLKREIFFGPLVADTAFTSSGLKRFNRFIALYHDQGLIPLKTLFFDKSINVSLNLPIIRTSVDHGTAYDIAYNGIADNQSYIEAVKFANNLASLNI